MKKQKNPNKTDSNWYNASADQVLTELKTSQHGLSDHEADVRLNHYGPNILSTKKESWLKRLLEPFASLFIVILLVAMVVSLIMDERFDALIIGAVVILNALVYYFQQASVSRVLKTLKSHEDGQITVIRNGKTKEISAVDLVPGDLVFVFEGLKIPADGRVIESSNLQIDESILTGESLPEKKSSEPLSKKLEIYDQSNMVFKGTIAQSGNGQFVVTSTGNKTELGAITTLTSLSDIGKTPIEKKIDDVTHKFIQGIGFVAVLVFVLALIRGISTTETLRFTVSLVVSIVPENLPVTLTVVLLLSAKRMAGHKVLVKKLSAIETMGAVTLIATDKTGTITANKLAVAEVFPSHSRIAMSSRASVVLQNDIGLDPLDTIINEEFKETKISGKLVRSFPFDQKLRMSGSLWSIKGAYVLFLKGAPEAILSRSSTDGTTSAKDQLKKFTSKGYRTIALAHVSMQKELQVISDLPSKKLTFDGLIALADPIRKNIPHSIDEAHMAGINVVMLTGDHQNTAAEIGRQAKLVTNISQVADSKLLEKPPNKKIMKTILERIKVFGRVLPKHKFNFLKSVKNTEVTAMTGDGVNDIPALAEADVGLAMGSGTDAAKDASDIVLLDDNFQTIITAVRLGRSVVANIKKMLFYLISTSIGEAGTMVGALLFGLPLPVTAVQILWINIVTDTFTVLPIGLAKPEKHQMKSPPNNPKNPILSNVLLWRTLIAGLTMASSSVFIFWLLLPKGYAYAQSAAFTALVVTQWANALNANFEHKSWVNNFIQPNLKLFAGIAISMLLQLIVIFGPLREAFGVEHLSGNDLALSLILPTISVLLLIDLHKFFVRKNI